ncbi:MAG: biopolymer transporter ExbD [Chthoniobacterales bacterium]|jgi:biopolymer transport protein ExbD
MQADSGGEAIADINVTPMVDLYLVLLLIFIIMTSAGIQGVKVNLPKGSSAPSMGGPKTQAVTVNNEGAIFLNTLPVTLPELEQKLQEAKSANPETPVVVRGDSATQYQGIMDVLDVIGRIGMEKVGLATQKRQ